MRQLAEVQPRAVILESHSRLEHLLREVVPVKPAGGNAGSGRFPSVRSLARQAESAGLITRQELSVLDELTNLRNVVAHTRESAITYEQAMNYAELARQIAISIRLAAGDVGYDQPPL
jgi:hypothetical protein